ncbi:hypothetical protein C6P40_002401 [Pichia californica]|uniref:Uncharacterized protein n=1 Tax=Pichia californica TaxID=460514 RepID=A0A9P7BCW0_9ASCO|nr:hypothetical protein C6P40_002401 [[Candida] californica]
MPLSLVLNEIVAATTTVATGALSDEDITTTLTKTITSTYTTYLTSSYMTIPTTNTVASSAAAATATVYEIVSTLSKRDTSNFNMKMIAAIIIPIIVTLIVTISTLICWYLKRLNKSKNYSTDEKKLPVINESIPPVIHYSSGGSNYIHSTHHPHPAVTPLALDLPMPSTATSFDSLNYKQYQHQPQQLHPHLHHQVQQQQQRYQQQRQQQVGKYIPPRAYPPIIKLPTSGEINSKKNNIFVNHKDNSLCTRQM